MVPAFLLVCTMAAIAADMNFMPADEFKSMLYDKKPVVIADIQKLKEFKKHHIFASIETSVYPVKTDDSKRLLDNYNSGPTSRAVFSLNRCAKDLC